MFRHYTLHQNKTYLKTSRLKNTLIFQLWPNITEIERVANTLQLWELGWMRFFLSHKNVKINQYQHRGAHRYLHLKWLLLKSCLQLLLRMCLRTLLLSNSSTTCGELVLCHSETLPHRVQWPPAPWSDTSQSIQESECHNLSEEKKINKCASVYLQQCKSSNRCTALMIYLFVLPQFYIRKFPFYINAESLCSRFAFFELLSWHGNPLGLWFTLKNSWHKA